jgi:hypothetical protein
LVRADIFCGKARRLLRSAVTAFVDAEEAGATLTLNSLAPTFCIIAEEARK